MAKETLNETEGGEFFTLDAAYSINPGSTPEQLINDFQCLSSSGMAVLLDAACEAPEGKGERIFAAYYLLKQALAANSHAVSLLHNAGKLDL